ncbi:MAG: IS66 family transposase [Phycisphaerae bacterium]|nr:IS66 family transposase [Phycisphaerae bacterium]NIX30739.1 IS66 family transposase [Phycisphaerae bacterium]
MPLQHYKPAASDFQCPYKHNCPHLEHLSAQWVWEEYQHSSDEHLEHWKVRDIQQEQLEKALDYIGKLEEENEKLRAKLKALHQRQFKANKNRCRQSSENNADQRCATEKKKKRGAPKGHRGWYRRKPDHIDKTVMVAPPQVCPYCACEHLSPVAGLKDHLQEDIILKPRTHVTNFRHQQAFCPKCRRPVIQAAEGELLNCPIGPTTKAAAVYLRYGLNIPYRKVKELFEVFFNMPFVPASAMNFDRQATKKGQPLYQDLKQKVRALSAAHADETFWRQNGINHFLWYGGSKKLALFLIARHRSGKVAQSIFGNDFDGVLHADGYAGYNAINAKQRQTCLAHLIRKSKEIKHQILLKKPRYQDKDAIRFCNRIGKLFKKACQLAAKFNNDHICQLKADAFQHRLYCALHTICSAKLADDNAETLKNRLLDPQKEYQRLFTFLKYPDVEPTNNQAEQSLRNLVIFRKICFGTRSHQGSHSHSVLPSLLVTARRQGQHPLAFFKTLFTADTTTAQAALYNDSS